MTQLLSSHHETVTKITVTDLSLARLAGLNVLHSHLLEKTLLLTALN